MVVIKLILKTNLQHVFTEITKNMMPFFTATEVTFLNSVGEWQLFWNAMNFSFKKQLSPCADLLRQNKTTSRSCVPKILMNFTACTVAFFYENETKNFFTKHDIMEVPCLYDCSNKKAIGWNCTVYLNQ
jgi:hypothetical protein